MPDADSVCSPATSSPEIVPSSPVSTQIQPSVEAVGESKGTVGSWEKKDFIPPPARKVKKHRLKPTQEAFIKHYTDPNSPVFGNGKQSYLKVHPQVTPGSAEALASNTLSNVKVQAVIAEHWGLDRLENELEKNINACWDTQKLGDHREGLKVLAQLTGQWKERQEITHLEDAQKDAIRREVSKALGSN